MIVHVYHHPFVFLYVPSVSLTYCKYFFYSQLVSVGSALRQIVFKPACKISVYSQQGQ